MFDRIKNIVIKELIQAFRDKRMWFFLFLVPVVELFIFGYVASTDVSNIPTALYDLDQSYESRELARRLEASGYFTINYRVSSTAELGDLLERSKILCAIQINSGFQNDLRKGIPGNIQVLVDGTESNTALVATGYINRVIATYAASLTRQKAAGRAVRIDMRTNAWYNPELKSRIYAVPGVIGAMIMLMCLMLTSMAIVREREAGTMEQLMVTPIKPAELMIGKTIPFAAIGLFDMLIMTLVGVFWFDVPVRGSILFLLLATVIYLVPVLGIGLYISTAAKTQQQALLATMLFYMIAVLLSGFIFPIENMPRFFQYITYINPLRYFLVIIRGVFLKNNGFAILWPQLLALFILGVKLLTFSSLRFRKRLG